MSSTSSTASSGRSPFPAEGRAESPEDGPFVQEGCLSGLNGSITPYMFGLGGSMRLLFGAMLSLVTLFCVTGSTASAAINGFEGGDGDQVSPCTVSSDWNCLPANEILSAPDVSGLGDD